MSIRNIYNTSSTFGRYKIATKIDGKTFIISVNAGYNKCEIFFLVHSMNKEEIPEDVFIVSPENHESCKQNMFARFIIEKYIIPKAYNIGNDVLYLFEEDIEEIYKNIYNVIK